MVGGGVEPPASPTEAAAGLLPRRLRPRRASAKRSWPPGCGRSPAPPPAAGDGLNGAVGGARVLGGGADEVVAGPAAVSPLAQNGSLLRQQGSDAADEAAARAAVSPVARNGALPRQQGLDKVETALGPVQNGVPPWQGHDKMGETVAPAAVSPVASNGGLQRTLPESGLEKAGEDGDKGENGEAQLLDDAGVPALDGQEGNSSAQNGGERCGLLVAEGEMRSEEVAGDGNVMEMGNRAGDGESERKENGFAGSRTKRCLTSEANPQPKKRAVAGVCKIPPGYERTAVTTKKSGVLEVSPVCAFRPGCGRTTLTAIDSEVLDIQPIRTFPPSCGRSALTTIGSGDEDTNGDALAAIPVSGGATSQTLALDVSHEKMERKRMVDEGNSNSHSRDQVPDDFVGTEQDGNMQRNVDAKSTPRNSSNEKMKGKLSGHEGRQVARVVVDDKMKNKNEGSLHGSTPKTPLSDPIDAKTKGKRLESDMLNVALLGNAGGEMQSKTLSTKKEVVCSSVNIKKNKSARKLNKFGKAATNEPEGSGDMNLIPDQLIVQALMAPDRCPWTRGWRSIASASKSLAPRNKLNGKDAAYRKFTQLVEQGNRDLGRVDLEAIKALKKDPIYNKPEATVGNIPGVEVGDEFHFRVELSMVGLHRPYQGGIDTTKVNGVPIAISIVASGGYPDELSSSDELIYTGSGRKVVECWQEGLKGERVFKYKLQRIAGQPELAVHAVKATRKSKVREGLCLPDISEGSKRIPICVINTIDDMRPAPFKYITKVIYPTWYEKEPPKGCDCINGCSDSITCACVVKTGGEILFNSNGAIVEASPLIYECGPSCRCPPTCHNRVSQHGVKIPLEIFKTELWEGLKSVVGVQSSTLSSKTMEGFTIDAAECGNVGRFINHSCSPNLYAQNILWDHDDMRMPHVMLFAVENIPPLQELTYHYNYTVGQVLDENGKEKVKHCYCGASDCCGRLY
ncbi:uncharacterized protein C2845_PM03G32740 [Panicum miliaceum]|uniref:Histone-lysine N-methyltransferase, H3 lysine-9 specific SUVH6-like n=1 Tax=Panicum miliaceum TaxID=4540 RepID=A0A3L6T8E8_PANMI|nr:uncharacterized protein C2845_PM03G32740 [Panicum miliaceum]